MTREPGNGLPSKDCVTMIGDMLVVEFMFGDVGDRAVALSEIGELKFSISSRQPDSVKEEGDYIEDGAGGWEPNPNLLGSIDVCMKRDKNKPSWADRGGFYFYADRRTWRTILNSMSIEHDNLFGQRGIVIERPYDLAKHGSKSSKTVVGAKPSFT